MSLEKEEEELQNLPAELLVRMVCPDYLKDHLIPMIKRDGVEVCIERLHTRTRFRPSICRKIVEYLSQN